MAVTSDRPAPYTAPKAILDIIGRFRDRGLPSPIDAEVLERSGVVSDSLIPRTLQAMQTLDLIDDKGVPTGTFDSLRRAAENEYEDALKDWLKAAYADVFNFVDPSNDDATRIHDAFRSYNPQGQRNRMVTLFIGLCTAAGLMPEKETPRQSTAAAPPRQRSPRPSAADSSSRAGRQRRPSARVDGIPAPLAGLLETLPSPDTGWTMEKRNKFVAAFKGVLDFCVPIIDAGGPDQSPEGDGQTH